MIIIFINRMLGYSEKIFFLMKKFQQGESANANMQAVSRGKNVNH